MPPTPRFLRSILVFCCSAERARSRARPGPGPGPSQQQRQQELALAALDLRVGPVPRQGRSE